MINITFKKHPAQTGLSGVGYPYQSVDIKIKKKRFGIINAPNWQTEGNVWKIMIAIKKPEPDDNPNCDWKWITFKKDFEDETQARTYIQESIVGIMKKFELHYFDD